MDQWPPLSNRTADKPLSEKIISDRPADVHDQCTNGLGQELVGEACVELVQPLFAEHAAHRRRRGAHLRRSRVPAQAAQPRKRLRPDSVHRRRVGADRRATFPDGVCDYSKAALDKQPTIPPAQLPGCSRGHGGRRKPAPRVPPIRAAAWMTRHSSARTEAWRGHSGRVTAACAAAFLVIRDVLNSEALLATLGIRHPLIQAPMAASPPPWPPPSSIRRPRLAGPRRQHRRPGAQARSASCALTAQPFNLNFFCHRPAVSKFRCARPHGSHHLTQTSSRSSATPAKSLREIPTLALNLK